VIATLGIMFSAVVALRLAVLSGVCPVDPAASRPVPSLEVASRRPERGDRALPGGLLAVRSVFFADL
jgi:hypothetical protein